jgi:hypothetical protein
LPGAARRLRAAASRQKQHSAARLTHYRFSRKAALGRPVQLPCQQAVTSSSDEAIVGERRWQSVHPPDVAQPNRSDERELAPVWVEWRRLTRFLESARLAFARECNLWTSLELRSSDAVKLLAATAYGTYRASLKEHLDAVRDEETLLASVLIHSYALAENAAGERLGGEPRDFGGIEDWGTRLLATTGSTWDSLNEGRAGAVEVAVIRNVDAHGGRRIDESGANRLRAVGMTSPMRGDMVALDYPTLKRFRGKLRALMDQGGVGREAS